MSARRPLLVLAISLTALLGAQVAGRAVIQDRAKPRANDSSGVPPSVVSFRETVTQRPLAGSSSAAVGDAPPSRAAAPSGAASMDGIDPVIQPFPTGLVPSNAPV